jgi:hypothetical protein
MYYNKYLKYKKKYLDLKGGMAQQQTLDIDLNHVTINITTLGANRLTVQLNPALDTFDILLTQIQNHINLPTNQLKYFKIIENDIVHSYDIILTSNSYWELHDYNQIEDNGGVPIGKQIIDEIFPNHQNIINLTLVFQPIENIIIKYYNLFDEIMDFASNINFIFSSDSTKNIIDACHDKKRFLPCFIRYFNQYQFTDDDTIRKIFKKCSRPHSFYLIGDSTLDLDNLELITINYLCHGNYPNRNNIGILRFLLRQSFYGLILYAPISFLINFITCRTHTELPLFFQTKKSNSWEVIFNPRKDALINFLKCLFFFKLPFMAGPNKDIVITSDADIGIDIIIQILKEYEAIAIDGEILLENQKQEKLFKQTISDDLNRIMLDFPVSDFKLAQLFTSDENFDVKLIKFFTNDEMKRIFFNPIDESILSESDFLVKFDD